MVYCMPRSRLRIAALDVDEMMKDGTLDSGNVEKAVMGTVKTGRERGGEQTDA